MKPLLTKHSWTVFRTWDEKEGLIEIRVVSKLPSVWKFGKSIPISAEQLSIMILICLGKGEKKRWNYKKTLCFYLVIESMEILLQINYKVYPCPSRFWILHTFRQRISISIPNSTWVKMIDSTNFCQIKIDLAISLKRAIVYNLSYSY